MNWLPLHLRQQVHLSETMLKKRPSNFINKFKFQGNKKSRKQEINFVPFYNFRKNKLQKYKVLVE